MSRSVPLQNKKAVPVTGTTSAVLRATGAAKAEHYQLFVAMTSTRPARENPRASRADGGSGAGGWTLSPGHRWSVVAGVVAQVALYRYFADRAILWATTAFLTSHNR